MAKELCPNCNTKMGRPVSFCPVCSRPTPHATDAERMEWDLGQWRRHVDRSVGVDAVPGSVTATAVVSRPSHAPAPDLDVIVTPERAAEPVAVKRSRPIRMPRIAMPSMRLPVRRRSEPEDRVIVLDADNPFAYTTCTTCERKDWVVRTTRNEDGTYNYWCVRCSRSFKSDVWISHALKPIASASSVIGAIVSLTILMR